MQGAAIEGSGLGGDFPFETSLDGNHLIDYFVFGFTRWKMIPELDMVFIRRKRGKHQGKALKNSRVADRTTHHKSAAHDCHRQVEPEYSG